MMLRAIKGGGVPPEFSIPRRTYKCTVCRKVGFWDKNWSYYGSLIHAETCPADLPYACSETCRKKVEENIKSGNWEIPKLSTHGGGAVVKDRRGY